MSPFIAALPMYDWPETRRRTDAQWATFRDAFREAGITAPEHLTRRNGDFRPRNGAGFAPNEAENPPNGPETGPDGFDIGAVWRHPDLLFGQTCWGPMGEGLADHVQVIGQPDYSNFEGGSGELYSSALLMRTGSAPARHAPEGVEAALDAALLKGMRLAFNGTDSMSGYIALRDDLEAVGEGLGVFSEHVETGSHRASAIAVAQGRADVCTVDCRSWALITEHEPAARDLSVVGWTAKRLGLPYICSRRIDQESVGAMRSIVAGIESR